MDRLYLNAPPGILRNPALIGRPIQHPVVYDKGDALYMGECLHRLSVPPPNLPGPVGFYYESMINNKMLKVKHKFKKFFKTTTASRLWFAQGTKPCGAWFCGRTPSVHG
jgi:hypothetical protein